MIERRGSVPSFRVVMSVVFTTTSVARPDCVSLPSPGTVTAGNILPVVRAGRR
jgi:hypothetical protein